MSDKKKKTHSNQSFSQLMSQAQLNALKPYIDQQSHIILNKVSKLVLDHLANIQTRHLAIESLLKSKVGLTQEEINFEITEQEDMAFGYQEAEVAAEGDLVRLEVRSKIVDAENFSEWEKIRINSLLRKVEDRVQTLLELENLIVGMVKNEEKEFVLKGEGENSKDSCIQFKINKVSRKIEGKK